ncbi:methyltransferase domain-containing protein [Candidatus Pacearchaeota archaeon]|nr:methyltransferase domain-containing protein [Candidatus Pacearchaeota archaeon]MBD3283378.1 methyltransferase domain-containing protein [Candidatus Pacearchaeota archaeon]
MSIQIQKINQEPRNSVLTKTDNLKVNFGCGEKIYEDFINIDRLPLPNVDLVWDLEKTPLPFKSNSVSEIKCEHILEHVKNFMPLIEELWRICKPGAFIKIYAPYFRYEAAYRDPTHVRFFTEHSFDYFQDGLTYSYYSKARFKIRKVELRNNFFSGVKNLHKKIIKFIPFKKFLNIFFWNIYSEVYYELEVVK